MVALFWELWRFLIICKKEEVCDNQDRDDDRVADKGNNIDFKSTVFGIKNMII